MKNSSSMGNHYLVELYGCNSEEINSEKFLKKALSSSVEKMPIRVLDSSFHTFKPQGVTGFLLLSASHISIHTWPERGYVAFDIFTCSNEKVTKEILEHILNSLQHAHLQKKFFKRGYVFNDLKTS